LTSLGGAIPRAAPDGQRVYYTREQRGLFLWSVSAAGGDERPVAGMGSLDPVSFAAWEVGPRGIHYLGGGGRPALLFLDFATGRSRRVADLPRNANAGYCNIALAPDGKSLVIPRHEGTTSDIMLVEDFRLPTE
jgi:hypothetical protein